VNPEAGTIAARLADVRERMARAASAAGRDVSEIRLLAISKSFPSDAIRAAAAADQRLFGENRVQEALQKMSATSDLTVEWHLVGHLQRNKARVAAQNFACIHSIDSLELLHRVDAMADAAGRAPDIFIQVSLAGETTKSGLRPGEVEPLARAAGQCRAVRLAGLMTLPPYADDPEASRPFFRQLRELRDRLVSSGHDPGRLRELSMGMSHDFEIAIQEGATIVRVGTAIFGSRV
jgi:pyridoxal phosphate enzyme (YggS family)